MRKSSALLRRRMLVVLAVLSLSALGVGAFGPAPAAADGYEVRAGDTLSGIAARLGVAPSVLRLLNPDITSDDVIYAGQTLRIPDNVTVPEAPAGSSGSSAAANTTRTTTSDLVNYVVRPGDTLSDIAQRHRTSVSLLLRLNPGLDANLLFSGLPIKVPRRSGSASASSGGSASTGANGSAATRQTASSAASAPDFSANPGVPYEVQPGDTATSIAASYGMSVIALQAANPGRSISVLQIGQILRIPVPNADVPAKTPSEGQTVANALYTVRSGDNASGIAAAYGIPLSVLRRLNPAKNLEMIYIGDVLAVPQVEQATAAAGTVPAGPPPAKTYSVVSGDTLSGIADAHGLSLAGLRNLNPQLASDLLTIGQVLRIPGTVPIPKISSTLAVDRGGSIEIVAGALGVLPWTLTANNPGINEGWIPAGTALRVPDGEGVIVTVNVGDTLQGIAATLGSSVSAIIGDPRSGVADPNGLIAGQELLVPINVPSFSWPVSGSITDGFGLCRTDDCSVVHWGTDIAQIQSPGGAVLAIADGVVRFNGGAICCGLGFYVEIDHGNGWSSVYGHLASPAPVAVGQPVSQGDVIGYSGSTGFSTGVHLHLELEHNGYRLDALNYLP